MRRKCTAGEREEVGELVIAASSYLQNAAAVGVGTFSQQPVMTTQGGLVANRGRRFKWAIELSGPGGGSR